MKFISATAIESSCPSAGLFEDSVRVVPKSEHHLVSQLQYAFETSKRKREKRRAGGGGGRRETALMR